MVGISRWICEAKVLSVEDWSPPDRRPVLVYTECKATEEHSQQALCWIECDVPHGATRWTI